MKKNILFFLLIALAISCGPSAEQRKKEKIEKLKSDLIGKWKWIDSEKSTRIMEMEITKMTDTTLLATLISVPENSKFKKNEVLFKDIKWSVDTMFTGQGMMKKSKKVEHEWGKEWDYNVYDPEYVEYKLIIYNNKLTTLPFSSGVKWGDWTKE